MPNFDSACKTRLSISMLFTVVILISGCSNEQKTTPAPNPKSATNSKLGSNIEFEKYTLKNGLDVILHVDRSDPIVSINLAAHVGSNRETTGRTGFAHLFEHLLFLDSENLGYGGLDEMNTRIGGEGTNGFTTNDMTQYFQTVPADALEKVIWAEADKLGYFINTVTQGVIDNEKQVVKNEKRQRVDNRPYGHRGHIVSKQLYPQDHPYNWTVIGSLADLQAATLADVKSFYRQWYVPNNVTVTLSGDFNVGEAKTLIKKYFADIPRGPEVTNLEARPGKLENVKSLYHEDNFATVPQLSYVWPTVNRFHNDAPALGILSQLLSDGKKAPLNEVLIDEKKLTSNVDSFHFGKELAGEFYLTINANADTDLDELKLALQEGFNRFEKNGIESSDLDRIKAEIEVGFYNDIQSSLGKAIRLAEYNSLAGNPELLNIEVHKLKAVNAKDIMRVYQRYIKEQPYLATSFVPKGKAKLALEGAIKASIVEEVIVENTEAEVSFDPTARTFKATPSKFDRTIEPEFGAGYNLPKANIWKGELANGIKTYGIENRETPLVYFSLRIDAGRNRGQFEKPAIANLTGDMLTAGTATKTTAELENSIKLLGSNIEISTNSFNTTISVQTLSRNLEATTALVEEILLEPRWDEEEFDLLKRRQLNQIDQDAGNPNAIATREIAKLDYPEKHLLSYQAYGTKAKLELVTLDDLKAFYKKNYSPSNASLRVVGDATSAQVESVFSSLSKRWKTSAPAKVELDSQLEITVPKVYFYDIPGAKQSVIQIKRPSLSAIDPDYPLTNAINYFLGGIYTSKLNTELRVNKGYTYGIFSRFSADKDRGSFSIGSSVRSNVTLESVQLIREIVDSYTPDFTEENLATLKDSLLRGQALKNETLNSKLAVLGAISSFGYADDYQAKNAALIKAMTLTQFKALGKKLLNTNAMNYLVVGDANTQLERLSALGMGKPILLNP